MPSIAVGETPPLFLIDDKGVAQLVNYRVQGRFYVVDRTSSALFARTTSEIRAAVSSQSSILR